MCALCCRCVHADSHVSSSQLANARGSASVMSLGKVDPTVLAAKKRATAAVTEEPVGTALMSPSRPLSSLPKRHRRESAKGKRFEQPHRQHANVPQDLLSDLSFLDKHQFVDKLVVERAASSTNSAADVPIASPTSFMPALLLNADYQPLSFTPLSLWSWQEAVKAVFRGKVTVVDVYENVNIRGVNIEIPLPSVIALNEYVSQHSATPAFTKRNVYLRDEYKCQYCNQQSFSQSELSLDHVLPRCKGGRLHWENAVTSCLNCNGRKGSLALADLESVGMRLLRPPKVPTQYELSRIASRLWLPRRKVHPTWKPFLDQYMES